MLSFSLRTTPAASITTQLPLRNSIAPFRRFPRSCVVILAAGVVRKLNESMFAASVASRAGFYGHDDDAVQNGLGLLGAAQSFLIIHAAGCIAAIGDHNQHFPSLPILQSLRAEIDRVV